MRYGGNSIRDALYYYEIEVTSSKTRSWEILNQSGIIEIHDF